MVQSSVYPLGSSVDESRRLDGQTTSLIDPRLLQLAPSAESILDIGCGPGLTLATLAETAPNARLVGIDKSEEFVHLARERTPTATIHVMDAQQLDLGGERFDLIVVRLVLWCVGDAWRQVIHSAYSLLRPGGVLYCFEPDDALLLFHPPKPALTAAITQWDEYMVQKRCDPFVGRQLRAAVIGAGFTPVRSRIVAMSFGGDEAAYGVSMDNLLGLYGNSEVTGILGAAYEELMQAARSEIRSRSVDDFVVEAYVTCEGVRPN